MGIGHHGRTYRLDWEDPTVREWECTVVWSDPADPEAGIVLVGTVFRDFGALVTGGNMEPGEARMDFNLPELSPGFKQAVEDAVNKEIQADHRIDVRFLPREEALADPGLVKTMGVAPPTDE